MSETGKINDQMLDSFVDGILDEDKTALVLDAMEQSPEIREQVYQLRRAKDLMKLGYANRTPPVRPSARKKSPRATRTTYAIAASVLLLIVSTTTGYISFKSGQQLALNNQQKVKTDNVRVIVHISQSNPEHYAAVFDYIESFLKQHESTNSKVEIVANAGGLELIRSKTSPHKDRIDTILKEHSNVHFIACANSIRSLRKKGVEPSFNRKVRTEKPAFDHIIDRVQDGWSYLKVESLIEI